MLAGGEGVVVAEVAGQGLGHDLAHDVAGGHAVPGVALAVPDVVRELAQLRDAVDHDAHGATPLEVDAHALERREGAFDARAQFAGDVSRVFAAVVGAAAEQQAAVGGHAVVVEDEAAVVDRQVLGVQALGQVAQRLGGDDAAHGGEDLALELLRLQLVVDVAGQQHLLGVDPALGGDHCRVFAVDDLQHFAVLENQCPQAFGGPGFAEAQIQRVQVQVAGVLDGAVVEVAFQQAAHLGPVQQADFVAHAAAQRFFVIGAQARQVAGLVGRVQMTVLEVAGDGVFFHPLLDDPVSAPAQVPDEIIDLVAQFAAHLLAHGRIAGKAAGDLATVAPGGAPADLVAFDDGDFQAALGQFHRAGNAGEAAADDHHIHLMAALQGRVVGFLIQGGAVVAGAALGCRGPRIEGGCH